MPSRARPLRGRRPRGRGREWRRLRRGRGERMFGSIGGPELLVIFVIALLIFGPRKLSEIGRTLGKGVAEFRKAATDLRDTLDAEVARSDSAPPKEKTSADPADQQGA